MLSTTARRASPLVPGRLGRGVLVPEHRGGRRPVPGGRRVRRSSCAATRRRLEFAARPPMTLLQPALSCVLRPPPPILKRPKTPTASKQRSVASPGLLLRCLLTLTIARQAVSLQPDDRQPPPLSGVLGPPRRLPTLLPCPPLSRWAPDKTSSPRRCPRSRSRCPRMPRSRPSGPRRRTCCSSCVPRRVLHLPGRGADRPSPLALQFSVSLMVRCFARSSVWIAR